MTLAASNKRVVLVDCDMRKSTVSRYMHISRSHAGLSNVITSRDISNLAGALVRMKEYNGITVLPVGITPRIRPSCSRCRLWRRSSPPCSALMTM